MKKKTIADAIMDTKWLNPKPQIAWAKELKKLKLKVKVKPTGIFRHSCGCTIQEPHSHLVFGSSCDCERGFPDNIRN